MDIHEIVASCGCLLEVDVVWFRNQPRIRKITIIKECNKHECR